MSRPIQCPIYETGLKAGLFRPLAVRAINQPSINHQRRSIDNVVFEGVDDREQLFLFLFGHFELVQRVS